MSLFRRAMIAPFRAVGRGVKALSEMRWSGQVRRMWPFFPLRTKFDYAKEVGDGTSSSIVVAVVNWIARIFPEAPLVVVDEKPDGVREKIVAHPMVKLIERPNPFYSGILLWMATLVDWAVNGNAYWLKVRAPSDKVVQLWYAPSFTMEPKWPNDGLTYISHYKYRPDAARQPIAIEPRDVVHFRYGLDPQNVRKGLSQLRSLLREIFTDEEASNMTASLMRNLGVPGVVLSPDSPNASVEKEDAEETKTNFMSKFGGDRRGEPLVMTSPTKVSVLAFSPEQMELRGLRRVPEERVTAVLGVAAVVVGLGAGLDRSTFTNFHEAREAAYEQNIIPTQRLMTADLRTQLLPDFDDDPAHDVDFDLSRVRVLQPDMAQLFERVNKAVNGGWFTVGKALQAVGQPAGPEHDVYLRPFNIQEVPAAGLGAAGGGDGGNSGSQKHLKQAGFSGQMARTRQRIADRFEDDMVRFFKAQAERVVERLSGALGGNGRKAAAAFNIGQLMPAEEDDLLADALRSIWLVGLEQGWLTAGGMFGLDAAFDFANLHIMAALELGPEQAKRINNGTRESIEATSALAETRGYSRDQAAFGVPEDDFRGIKDRVQEDYQNRPATVARTQAMWATNMGSAALYQDAGFQRVRMVDSTDHEPCASRNGRIVSVDAGMAATAEEHANGTLSLEPVAL